MPDEIKSLARPDFTAVLDLLKEDTMKAINCIQVGVVEAFDPIKQTVDVRLAIKKVDTVKVDGTRIFSEYPLLAQCPVVMLYGGGSYLTFPIAKGDECLVFFNDRQIDGWFLTGQIQAPDIGRLHDLSDGFALIGVRSIQKKLADYIANGVSLAFNETSKIIMDAGGMSIIAALTSLTGNVMVGGALAATTLHAGNGVSGTFGTVTVLNGIVVGGS